MGRRVSVLSSVDAFPVSNGGRWSVYKLINRSSLRLLSIVSKLIGISSIFLLNFLFPFNGAHPSSFFHNLSTMVVATSIVTSVAAARLVILFVLEQPLIDNQLLRFWPCIFAGILFTVTFVIIPTACNIFPIPIVAVPLAIGSALLIFRPMVFASFPLQQRMSDSFKANLGRVSRLVLVLYSHIVLCIGLAVLYLWVGKSEILQVVIMLSQFAVTKLFRKMIPRIVSRFGFPPETIQAFHFSACMYYYIWLSVILPHSESIGNYVLAGAIKMNGVLILFVRLLQTGWRQGLKPKLLALSPRSFRYHPAISSNKLKNKVGEQAVDNDNVSIQHKKLCEVKEETNALVVKENSWMHTLQSAGRLPSQLKRPPPAALDDVTEAVSPSTVEPFSPVTSPAFNESIEEPHYELNSSLLCGVLTLTIYIPLVFFMRFGYNAKLLPFVSTTMEQITTYTLFVLVTTFMQICCYIISERLVSMRNPKVDLMRSFAKNISIQLTLYVVFTVYPFHVFYAVTAKVSYFVSYFDPHLYEEIH
eukprot:GILJ01024007.1.p1 GENE.GILJ01024007.1~~GILJ01024007.1.p1  ORF type:complete len:531 (+),score=43.51 GILJ01024007.1:285-1877(+)